MAQVKVVATKQGFMGTMFREVGDVFEVDEALFTAKVDEFGEPVPPTWFERVDAPDDETV